MEDFRKKIFQGFAWEASTRLVVQIASWVSTVWVARLLTPEDYGLVAISGIFTGLCLTISSMGLGSSLVNKKEITSHDMANVFWTSSVLAILFYILLYYTAPYIARYYGSEELIGIIRVAGIMVIASPISVVPRALTMRQLKFKEVAIIAMFGNILVIAMTLYMAFAGYGYWALVVSTVCAEIFNLLAYSLVARYFPTWPHKIKTVLPLYKYGFSILLGRLTAYVNKYSQVMVSAQFIGNTSTGHLRMANTLAKIPMNKVGEIFSKIAFPAFSRIQDDRERTRTLFLTMHRYLLMLIAPMFVGITLVAEELIPLILGEHWRPVTVPIQILCLVNVLSGSAMIIPRVLEGLGNPMASFRYEALIAIVTVVAMLVGVRWGLNGMLIGYALAMPLAYSYLLQQLFSCTGVTMGEFLDSLKVMLKSLSLMVALVLVVDYCSSVYTSDLLLVLCLKILAGCLGYGLGAYMFGTKELKELFALIKNRGQ